MTPGPKPRDRKKEGKTKRWRQLDADKTLPVEETAKGSCSSSSTQAATPVDPLHEDHSRRKLPSNWGRYEEPEEDASNVNRKRGGDFELLLSNTAGSDAHFRFKEEQGWQEDFRVDEFLSLDCKLLADALRSVPIPERLGLPADIFPPEVYKQYVDDASRSKYGSGQLQQKLVSASMGGVPTKKETESKAAADRLANSLAACLGLWAPDKGRANQSPVSSSAEDELDFLFSLSKQNEEAKVQKEIEGPRSKVQQVVPGRGDEARPGTCPKPKDPSLNLEDWLDSMLDD